ncbi:hypothetical protein B0T14DRAFT_539932 [Immersiella caudata]|uniref:NAD(P)-binding domain-containing protein n=1 Tax=Immersiella caudata TaxID=314043 RepID=A0AA39WFL4_9PEZI|nr:hypothetical protein B0T14DRAFT_539932 [Immersiella caudata]
MAIAPIQPKAILFLGATGGCALSALRQSLTPALPSSAPHEISRVHIHQGNAHDLSAIRRVLVHPSRPDSLIDYVVSSIGNALLHPRHPLPMVALYKTIFAIPHRGKKAMEDALITSNGTWTIIRASALTNGIGGKTAVRAGLENPVKGAMGRKGVGYTILRGDGEEAGRKWVGKVASITY